jgi:hypothetical protein
MTVSNKKSIAIRLVIIEISIKYANALYGIRILPYKSYKCSNKEHLRCYDALGHSNEQI